MSKREVMGPKNLVFRTKVSSLFTFINQVLKLQEMQKKSMDYFSWCELSEHTGENSLPSPTLGPIVRMIYGVLI